MNKYLQARIENTRKSKDFDYRSLLFELIQLITNVSRFVQFH